MSYLAKNNTYTTLSAGISSSATSMIVAAGTGDLYPVIASPDYTLATLQDAANNIEIIKITQRNAASDAMTIVRAQEGTTARAWALGDVVECRQTAALVQTAMGHPELTTGAHAATAISFTPAGNLAANNVALALAELDTEKEPAFTTLGFPRGGTGATTRAGAVAALGLESAEIAVTTIENATTNIGAAAGSNILLTTTATTITGFATAAAGVWRKVRVATGGITLTHSSTFVLPGAANIAAEAGDCFEIYSTGSGWVVREYTKATGKATVDTPVFPSGTPLLFPQSAAPTGWTKSTTHNDKTLRVVSGAASSGGSVAFSTVFGRTATDGTSLTIAQLAAHTHGAVLNSSVDDYDDNGSGKDFGTGSTDSQGSGSAHSHGLDLRVQYVDVIIATKD